MKKEFHEIAVEVVLLEPTDILTVSTQENNTSGGQWSPYH